MKTIIDSETGELIEVEEANEIAIRKLNEVGVDFEQYCDYYIKAQYFKEQYEMWLAKHQQQILDVMDEAFKGQDKKSIKTELGTITYVKESATKKVDTERMKQDGIYDKYLMLSYRKPYIKVSVNEPGHEK